MFKDYFVPEVRRRLEDLDQEHKAILFIDNCSVHPCEETLVSDDGKIYAKFLPANVTSLIQPMDQGVLESMKRIYRKTILKKLLEVDDDLIPHLKKINMLQVVEYISDAWNRVSVATLQNAWNSILQKKKLPLESSEPLDDQNFVQDFARMNL